MDLRCTCGAPDCIGRMNQLFRDYCWVRRPVVTTRQAILLQHQCGHDVKDDKSGAISNLLPCSRLPGRVEALDGNSDLDAALPIHDTKGMKAPLARLDSMSFKDLRQSIEGYNIPSASRSLVPLRDALREYFSMLISSTPSNKELVCVNTTDNGDEVAQCRIFCPIVESRYTSKLSMKIRRTKNRQDAPAPPAQVLQLFSKRFAETRFSNQDQTICVVTTIETPLS